VKQLEKIMSRHVFSLGFGIVLIALGFTITDRMLGPSLTEANARRILRGMTLQQVEAILGGPPTHREVIPLKRYSPDGDVVVYRLWWVGEAGAVVVITSYGGQVREAGWVPATSPSGPFARLRAWLGW
jgi:hypothetical protein